jgi:hypothetical protein
MSEIKHSPTPYKVVKGTEGFYIVSVSDFYVAKSVGDSIGAQADMNHLCLACNSFELAREALEMAIEIVNERGLGDAEFTKQEAIRSVLAMMNQEAK